MYGLDHIQSEAELDTRETGQFEFVNEWEYAQEIGLEAAFDEAEELELVYELLEITDEAELDQFLGKLIKRAWRGLRKIGRGVLRPLGGVLKAVAKKALPFLAGAAGTFFGGPAGGALGATLGSALGKALEMEFEGLSPEDQEFEMARRFIRMAGTAARQAALTQPGVDPQEAVRAALVTAAHQYVPALSSVGPHPPVSMADRRRRGRWIRGGRTIILFGV